MRFETRDGEIKTLFKRRGEEFVGIEAAAECETGSRAPFPTVMKG